MKTNSENLRQCIKEINRRINIKEIILPVVALRKEGDSLNGLCPFHNDGKQSFSVSEREQTYECSICGRNGDSIQFVQEYEKVSFIEAVKILAGRTGVQMPVFLGSKEANAS